MDHILHELVEPGHRFGGNAKPHILYLCKPHHLLMAETLGFRLRGVLDSARDEGRTDGNLALETDRGDATQPAGLDLKIESITLHLDVIRKLPVYTFADGPAGCTEGEKDWLLRVGDDVIHDVRVEGVGDGDLGIGSFVGLGLVLQGDLVWSHLVEMHVGKEVCQTCSAAWDAIDIDFAHHGKMTGE